MFLFILKIEGISRPKLHSNTSHVLIYRIMALTELFSSWNSNTSHVLIYRLLMFLLPGIWANSNTSHVLIYPVRYCALSGLSRIQIHLMFLFITASALSAVTSSAHSNTSHVLIYRYDRKPSVTYLRDSNTSHVLIYP